MNEVQDQKLLYQGESLVIFRVTSNKKERGVSCFSELLPTEKKRESLVLLELLPIKKWSLLCVIEFLPHVYKRVDFEVD